jgi:DNA-binding NarL/FixJ family response regulator
VVAPAAPGYARLVLEGTERKPLSPREAEVLTMIARGLTNPQIARRLGLTVHGVKFHLASVYRKLGVTNRTEAAVALLESKQRES